MHPNDKSPRTFTTYQPSGKIGLRACVFWLLICAPIAICLGLVLAWAQGSAHGWIASSICAGLYSLVVFVVFAFMVTPLHARSRVFLTVAGAAAAVLMLAARWAYVLLTCVDCEPGSGVGQLGSLSGGVGALLEGALMLVMGVFAFRVQLKTPYSETHRAWAKKEFELELWCTQPEEQLTQSLQEHGVQYLLDCPRASDLAVTPASKCWQTLKMTGHSVSDDPVGRWLTLDAIVHTREPDAKVKSQSTDFLVNWCVSDAQYQSLLAYSLMAVSDEAQTTETTETTQSSQLPEKDARPTPQELVAAVEALQARQFSEALALATAQRQHVDAQVHTDAVHICAQSHAGLLQWKEAVSSYEALYAIDPTEFNALQIALTRVMAGDLAGSGDWYSRALALNQTSKKMQPARMCTGYLSALEQAGEYAAVQPYLDWLAEGYRKIRMTDDHIVWTHGFPFFAEFLRKSKELMRKVRPDLEIYEWYHAMRVDLDTAGQSAIDQHVADLVTAR